MSFPITQSPRLRPISVTASQCAQASKPEYAVDGEVGTSWNSGGFQPQWIQFDLGQSYNIAKLRLCIAQTPSGHTRHQIFAGQTPDNLRLVVTWDGPTQDGQWLEIPSSANNVRYIQVLTTDSPSWVAWREIEIYQGLQYFGYYASALAGVGSGDYTAEISDHCNITWIGRHSISDTVSILQQATNLGMGAILSVDDIFFEDDATLQPDYVDRWLDYANAVEPFKDYIAAFYPMDEPFWNGRHRPPNDLKHDLELVITTIKQRFPAKPVAAIFAYPTVASADFVIPIGYDWIGFDCYDEWSNCQGHAITWYVNTVRRRLTSSQRMILVPPAWYPQIAVSNEQQHQRVSQAERYITLARSDSLFIAVFPFLWQTFGPPEDYNIGTQNMPLVKAKMRDVALATLEPRYSRIWPVNATASNMWGPGHSARAAIDGDLDSIWNSGAHAPQWVQLDFGHLYSISLIRLCVAQTPFGRTKHEIWVGQIPTDPDDLRRIDVVEGTTDDGQWIELLYQVDNVRYLRVVTTDSPSWVAWREIEVWGPISFPRRL